MSIRPADVDDFEAIAAITNFYITTTTFHFGYDPVTATALEAQWQGGRARYPWFVAEDAGEVVGYAKAGVWRDRPAYAWTTEIGLYVADRARGRGLGTALYTALLDELAARGFRSAIAGITLPNDASVKLHQTFDFTSVGTVREAGFKQGDWWDVEFWQKRLSTATAAPPR